MSDARRPTPELEPAPELEPPAEDAPFPATSSARTRPTISGETRRAATIVSGSEADMTARANAPRNVSRVMRTASTNPTPPARADSTKWATISVSVSDSRT